MRSIKTYVDILRKKGVYTCLQEVKKAIWPIWWTHSRVAIEQTQAERVSRYFWRKYKALIAAPLEKSLSSQPSKMIWTCWLQGRENAPEMVKQCLASIERYAQGYEIHLLTADNIKDYLTLPDYIWEEYQSGKMQFSHFSDIVRTALLVEYGGIWMDATVLLTGALPDYISQEPLFFFRKSLTNNRPHFGSNWFIAAQKGDPVMQRMLNVLYAYWREEKVARDYYIYHILMYLILTRNEQAVAMMKAMPYIPNEEVHVLQCSLFDNYDEKQWQRICTRSTIHKLTWKFNHNEPIEKTGTYYDYILHHMHI